MRARRELRRVESRKDLAGRDAIVVVDEHGLDRARDLDADVDLIERLQRAGRGDLHREVAAPRFGGLVARALLAVLEIAAGEHDAEHRDHAEHEAEHELQALRRRRVCAHELVDVRATFGRVCGHGRVPSDRVPVGGSAGRIAIVRTRAGRNVVIL
jgi:hypothetical protein